MYDIVTMIHTCINSGGLIPYDGIPTKEYVAVAIPLAVIYIFLAIAGIIFAIVCLVFNFVYRKKR